MILVKDFNSVSFHRQLNVDMSEENNEFKTNIEFKDMINNSANCYRIVVTAGSKSYPILRKDPNNSKAVGDSAVVYRNNSKEPIIILVGWCISRDDGRSYERAKDSILIDCGLNRVCSF